MRATVAVGGVEAMRGDSSGRIGRRLVGIGAACELKERVALIGVGSAHENTTRHLSYANVIATLALVFAMSGSAIAAKHYLLNSTKQISPSLLKKLHGRTGAGGPRGAAGAQGAPGAQGPAGAKGDPGSPSPSVLASGQSESGDYVLNENNTKSGDETGVGASYATPLPAPLGEGKYEYLAPGKRAPQCSGPGHAAPGFLCIYSLQSVGVDFEEVFNPEKAGSFGSGVFGFEIAFDTKSTSILNFGTWTVTAA